MYVPASSMLTLQKLIRTFYSQVTDAGANTHNSDDDDNYAAQSGSAISKPRRSSSTVVKGEYQQGASAGARDEDVGGPSNASMDGDLLGSGPSGRQGKKRGAYMREGPTVYKLIKPVMQAIRSARSTESVEQQMSMKRC
jgi:hypothetical protein